MGVVVGVDGSGRTHRLAAVAADGGRGAVWIRPPVDDIKDLEVRVEEARADGAIVLVDDAHRLPAAALRVLCAAARRGTDMVIARRPTIDQPELAELDETVAANGAVERLQPLDEDGVARLVADATDRPASTERAAAIYRASAGMPAVATALAVASPGEVPAGLAARVQRRLATMEPDVRRLAAVLALGAGLPDEVAARASGISVERIAEAVRVLHDNGMLVPGDEALIPAIAEAVLSELAPAERRRVHNEIAQAMLASGIDPLQAAEQLRAGRAVGPAAAEAYRIAGERTRFTDPEAAILWFDEAADAGADPQTLVAGRAEAGALLGHGVDIDGVAAPETDTVRIALVAGALEASGGRAERAANALLAAGPLGRMLAVPSLVAVGRLVDAEPGLIDERVPRPVRRLAEAAIAACDPAAAVRLFIEAAEAIQDAPPAVVLPDTPHALGALVAVTAGASAVALHLLDQALESGVGGPVAEDRHRLLTAWVRLRTGHCDRAVSELRRVADRSLAGRDRLLRSAIAAGIARRSGDIARMRDSWAQAERELARAAVDLFHVEVAEELVVASARLREHRRAAPLLDNLDAIVDRLGRPPAWATAVAWVRLQAAVAAEDLDAARAVVAALSAADSPGARAQAQRIAASCWADVLAGVVRLDEVVAATDALVEAELPWEASRLAGQAAIRTSDPTVARRLLERARDLTHLDPAAIGRPGETPTLLSEREIDVARLVLAGRTHKEIGAQLYLSPKTVEHHVARIRTKLGVTTRADFIAALRELLETDIADNPSQRSPNAVS